MLRLRDLCAQAGRFKLKRITLDVPRGSYGVLLGPPGSGKSVLVETLCGLRRVTSGTILLDGKDITHTDPKERSVGYVPQDYVLFPTKRVVDNIIFGLRMRGFSRRHAIEQVRWVLDLLGIQNLLDRWPETLSGGEKQRVALARALAIKPRILLLDEPVSALDEGLREKVCRDLRRLQRELGVTTIHVSHNMEEALTVSDWAAVLFDGKLAQVGSMRELLSRPSTVEVARFLRTENIITAQAEPHSETESVLRFGNASITVPGRFRGSVTLCVRPERLQVLTAPSADSNTVQAKLVDITDRGVYHRLSFDAGVPVVVFATGQWPEVGFNPGRTYSVRFPPEALHVIAAEGASGL